MNATATPSPALIYEDNVPGVHSYRNITGLKCVFKKLIDTFTEVLLKRGSTSGKPVHGSKHVHVWLRTRSTSWHFFKASPHFSSLWYAKAHSVWNHIHCISFRFSIAEIPSCKSTHKSAKALECTSPMMFSSTLYSVMNGHVRYLNFNVI